MKRIIVMIGIAAILAGLLAGCSEKTAVETVAETTAVTETTVVTEATTVPTEPKTWFEEQGFTLWRGKMAESRADEYGGEGTYGEATFYDSVEAYINVMRGSSGSTQYTLLDTDVKASVYEYALEKFSSAPPADSVTKNVKDAVDAFYKADTKGMTKEEWLEAHQDYKIILCHSEQTIKVGDYIFEKIRNAKRWSYDVDVRGESTILVDRETGCVYEPSGDFLGACGHFLLKGDQIEAEILTLYDAYIEWVKWEDIDIKDCIVTETMFAMVPDDVDSLAFAVPLVNNRRDVEAFKKDFAGKSAKAWEEKLYDEYIEGKEHLKFYYMAANY